MAQTTETAAPAAAKKSNTLLLALLAVVLIAGASGATWFLTHTKNTSASASGSPATIEKKKQPEYTLRLDSFTVNLADPEEAHFLRVTMELGLENAPKGDPGKEGAENSNFPIAQTRDAILSILTACKANDLLTSEGKEALKQRLVSALQQKLPEIGVRDVYFTEFLVQR